MPTSSTLFGLGERTASTGLPLQRTGIPLTLWNRDRPSEFADENLYGSHPLVLQLREGEVSTASRGGMPDVHNLVSPKQAFWTALWLDRGSVATCNQPRSPFCLRRDCSSPLKGTQ